MICAIDFGSCWIRSVSRNPLAPGRLSMFAERAEYALLADTAPHRRSLQDRQIPYADCDGALVVAGNRAVEAQWLSRVPLTPLLADGNVPADDPPARQMLSVLTEAMLPPLSADSNTCAVAVPGIHDNSETAVRNEEFLCRLVRMRGYQAILVNPAEAAMLATGSGVSFTGISIVMGAETTTVGIARYGILLASETIALGGNWVDVELAGQSKTQIWDESGNVYIDIESIRRWKHSGAVDLQNAVGDRERMMSRLYSLILDQVAHVVGHLLSTTPVRNTLQGQRLAVIVSGGAAMPQGIAPLLTQELVNHDIADRILSVRCAKDPATAVIRGALILAELEAQATTARGAA